MPIATVGCVQLSAKSRTPLIVLHMVKTLKKISILAQGITWASLIKTNRLSNRAAHGKTAAK
jgi:hypothetical protein